MGIPTQRNSDGKLVTSGAAAAHVRDEAAGVLARPLIDLTPAAAKVIDAIASVGGRPLLVGGCVRDALLGVDSKDVDIEAHNIRDYTAFRKALYMVADVDERGTAFGVIALRVDGEDFDIALPRRDSLAGRGHRGFDIEIDPDIDEAEAFSRRDFTINALGWDPTTNRLIDHFGGVDDLNAGILRHTSDSFGDDPLRVLRGVQFAARYGFTLAEDTVDISASIADRYRELSIERVWGEWRKIVRKGTHISSALHALNATTWVRHFPDLAATIGIEQDPHWHPEGDVYTHLGLAADAAAANADRDQLSGDDREVAVLAALTHDFGKSTSTQHDGDRITSHGHAEAGEEPAARFLTGIGAPKHVIDRVRPLVYRHMAHTAVTGKPSRAAVRRLMRKLADGNSGATIHDWARLVDADCAGRGPGAKPSPAPAWLALAHEEEARMKPLLNGSHLIAAGYQPGPGFAPILAAAVEAQDAGEFDDEAGALAWLAARA